MEGYETHLHVRVVAECQCLREVGLSLNFLLITASFARIFNTKYFYCVKYNL